MAEDKLAPQSDDQLEQRIARIEEMLVKNRELRSKLRLCAVSGSVLVLVILGLFAYRCYSIMANYNKYIHQINPEAVMKAFENPESDMPLSAHPDKRIDEALKYVIADAKAKIPPEVARSQKVITERVVPEFQELVVDKFEARSDEFEAAGKELSANLKTHAETRVQQQLFDAMVAGMNESEAEVHKIFPELEGKKLEDEFKAAESYLYDGIHGWGEERIAQFAPVLRVIDQRVEQLSADSDIPPAKQAEMREEIFNDFLEGLIDRIKYELIPGLGEQQAEVPAPPKGGGQ